MRIPKQPRVPIFTQAKVRKLLVSEAYSYTYLGLFTVTAAALLTSCAFNLHHGTASDVQRTFLFSSLIPSIIVAHHMARIQRKEPRPIAVFLVAYAGIILFSLYAVTAICIGSLSGICGLT